MSTEVMSGPRTMQSYGVSQVQETYRVSWDAVEFAMFRALGIPTESLGIPKESLGIPKESQGIPRDSQRGPPGKSLSEIMLRIPSKLTRSLPKKRLSFFPWALGISRDSLGISRDPLGISRDSLGISGDS